MKQENKPKKTEERMRFTNLNKDIPKPIIGNGFVIGWNSEIFGNNSVEYNFKLPLGAIRRLINSYFNDIYEIESNWVYTKTVGSCEMREEHYAYKILNYLKKELIKNKLDGQKIVDEIFEQNFKEKYDQLEKAEQENINNSDPQI